MAVSLQSKVWKRSPYSGNKLLVMLALCFYSDPAQECYLSVPEICQKTKISDLEVREILNSFLADGSIERAESTTHYGFKVHAPQKRGEVAA